jgi:hypothetical protein
MAAKFTKKRNWAKTNTEILHKTLNEEIIKTQALISTNEIFDNTKEGLDPQVDGLAKAIRAAIEASTPFIKICPKSKAGFTKECKEASLEAKRRRRTWQRSESDEDWKDYTTARNRP